MKYYCDGSGWNGRRSAYAIVAVGPTSTAPYTSLTQEFEENRTNNEMEYAAVIAALKLCSEGDEIITDSQLVVNQVLKGWRINYAHLEVLCKEAQNLVKEKNISLSWVPREQNLAGKLFE